MPFPRTDRLGFSVVTKKRHTTTSAFTISQTNSHSMIPTHSSFNGVDDGYGCSDLGQICAFALRNTAQRIGKTQKSHDDISEHAELAGGKSRKSKLCTRLITAL